MTNYWTEKRKNLAEQGWVVVASDMDGLTGYQVVHGLDAPDVQNGSYWGGAVKHLTLNRAEAQSVADELNAKNEPAPENKFRGMRGF